MAGAILSGPMFEPPRTMYWECSSGKMGAHYNIYHTVEEDGLPALRCMFPDAKANAVQFVLFSTSGVHGSYSTIEEAERKLSQPTEEREGKPSVTFLIVQPRICCLRYGNVYPRNADDIELLKSLRESSWQAISGIGKDENR